MAKTLIAQGAEAKIFLVTTPSQKIIKHRIKKSYRHPTLDEKLRKSRTRHEAKLLFKAREANINVPKVLNLNKKNLPTDPFTLEIEYIDGEKLSETLNSYPLEKQLNLMKKLAQQVSKMHENNIIHGDLTTSNVILKNPEEQSPENSKIFIIDFGLGFFSTKIEDKAVDLHLIKQALEAKHFQNYEKLFSEFIKNYKWTDSEKVIRQLEKVEKRGRYKH